MLFLSVLPLAAFAAVVVRDTSTVASDAKSVVAEVQTMRARIKTINDALSDFHGGLLANPLALLSAQRGFETAALSATKVVRNTADKLPEVEGASIGRALKDNLKA